MAQKKNKKSENQSRIFGRILLTFGVVMICGCIWAIGANSKKHIGDIKVYEVIENNAYGLTIYVIKYKGEYSTIEYQYYDEDDVFGDRSYVYAYGERIDWPGHFDIYNFIAHHKGQLVNEGLWVGRYGKYMIGKIVTVRPINKYDRH